MKKNQKKEDALLPTPEENLTPLGDENSAEVYQAIDITKPAEQIPILPIPGAPSTFFKQLYPFIDGVDLSIRAERRNGLITLQVLPKATGVINPVKITGTPDELDEGFFTAIAGPLQQSKGLILELDELNKSLESAKRIAEAKVKIASKPAEKQAEVKKESVTASKKAAQKEKIKKEKKADLVPDMFG